MRIERLTEIGDVGPLATVAREEGFRFLDRLIAEWEGGTIRFAGPGEALFGAWDGDRLVGTGGLTRQDERLGRVRRVYVHPAFRRRGIAGALMARVLDHARSHFPTLVLYTETPEAAQLYERLGFVPESPDGTDRATHRLVF